MATGGPAAIFDRTPPFPLGYGMSAMVYASPTRLYTWEGHSACSARTVSSGTIGWMDATSGVIDAASVSPTSSCPFGENEFYLPKVTMLEANRMLYMAVGTQVFVTDFTQGPCQCCVDGGRPITSSELASGLVCAAFGNALSRARLTPVNEMAADAINLYYNGPHRVSLTTGAKTDLASGDGPFFIDDTNVTWLGLGGPVGGTTVRALHRVSKAGGAPQVLTLLNLPNQSFPLVHGKKTFVWQDGQTLYAIVAN